MFARAAVFTSLALITLSAAVANAQTLRTSDGFHVLYRFCSQPACTDGGEPSGGLIADSSGNLYGTTANGGNTTCDDGCGTVFKYAPDGTYSVLFAFSGGATGFTPADSLIMDGSGNLYGVTQNGGKICAQGCGEVFKLAPDGTETVVHSFGGGGGDGTSPKHGLVMDRDGTIFGTTRYGGNTTSCQQGSLGCGVVFRLRPNGEYKVLHAFTGYGDGSVPSSGLIFGQGGKLYGVTDMGGGNTACTNGCGAVYSITPGGEEAVVYAFNGTAGDGQGPSGGLARDNVGNLYGTTYFGGTAGHGTVFKLTPDGTESLLHSFLGGSSDGAFPVSGLTRSGQFLYGTTEWGGSGPCTSNGVAGCGTVFQVGLGGTETVLFAFDGGKQGSYSQSPVTVYQNGKLVGTATHDGNTANCVDGSSGCGTLFELRK